MSYRYHKWKKACTILEVGTVLQIACIPPMNWAIRRPFITARSFFQTHHLLSTVSILSFHKRIRVTGKRERERERERETDRWRGSFFPTFKCYHQTPRIQSIYMLFIPVFQSSCGVVPVRTQVVGGPPKAQSFNLYIRIFPYTLRVSRKQGGK